MFLGADGHLRHGHGDLALHHAEQMRSIVRSDDPPRTLAGRIRHYLMTAIVYIFFMAVGGVGGAVFIFFYCAGRVVDPWTLASMTASDINQTFYVLIGICALATGIWMYSITHEK